MKHTILLTALALSFTGCVHKQAVIVGTGTVLGFEIDQNPATQMYRTKFGYGRTEVAYVPPNTNAPYYYPDVLLEFKAQNILQGGGLYQRLAVGKDAVSQPGAAFMFAKDPSGQLNSTTAVAIATSLKSIDSASGSSFSAKVPLATAFKEAVTELKAGYDKVAQAHGWKSFSDFLSNPKVTSEDVAIMKEALKNANIMP